LRFGIGSDFSKGRQVEYVLGKWTAEQATAIPQRAEICIDIIRSFCLAGMELTMTQFNGK
jgi:PTH1 family peptidyl-tRNA hydrolase